MWGAIFAFAYWRRPFGGSARAYGLAFVGAWSLTMAIFVVMAFLEAS